jgi:lysozyme
MIPNSKPQVSRAEIESILRAHGVTDKVCLVGVRGYYRDSMGQPGRNDRAIYDDAIIVISPSVYSTYNANTDPTPWRHGVASLRPGVHRYRKGNHGISKPGGGYPALRPATKNEALPVDRDGIASPEPGIAINIHKGGNSTTSSLGCQTIPPGQWSSFIETVYSEMKREGQDTIPYVLIVGPIR